MKAITISFFLLFSLISLSQKEKVHITPNQLIKNLMDWSKIEIVKPETKKELIYSLIEQNKIYLCYSGNINNDKDLERFMEIHSNKFHLIDLNADGTYELVFNGYDCNDLDNELIYFFVKINGSYEVAYTKKGNLIGYQINPNTNEILLIHFMYPCCINGSNNLNTLRLVNGQIIEFRKEFFAGRINHMKGPFLPEKINRTGKVITTTKEVELRWSPAEIDTLAWRSTVQRNVIMAYPKGSKFRVLSEKTNEFNETWLFVISKSPPNFSKGYIVEPSNFKDIQVYGWLRKEDY